MKRIIIGTGLVLLLAVAVSGYFFLKQLQFHVDIPEYQAPPEKFSHADQGWTDDQRLHFHHTPQGTRLVPYTWFMALEQPCLSLFGCGLLSDKTYLARFGNGHLRHSNAIRRSVSLKVARSVRLG